MSTSVLLHGLNDFNLPIKMAVDPRFALLTIAVTCKKMVNRTNLRTSSLIYLDQSNLPCGPCCPGFPSEHAGPFGPEEDEFEKIKLKDLSLTCYLTIYSN